MVAKMTEARILKAATEYEAVKEWLYAEVTRVDKHYDHFGQPAHFEYIENGMVVFSEYHWGDTTYYEYPLSEFFATDEELAANQEARKEAARVKDEAKKRVKTEEARDNRRATWEKLNQEFGNV